MDFVVLNLELWDLDQLKAPLFLIIMVLSILWVWEKLLAETCKQVAINKAIVSFIINSVFNRSCLRMKKGK